MTGSRFRPSYFTTILALAVLAPPSATAQAAYELDVPAQKLGDALRAVGRQTNTNVIFEPSLVKGLDAGSIRAELTADQAIQQLLMGTRLAARRTSAHTVVVHRTQETATPPTGNETSKASKEVQETSFSDRFRVAQADQEEDRKGRSAVAQGGDQLASTTLEEIVVTAQKREERLMDVPLTVSAISGEDLVTRNISDTQSLAFAVPSLTTFQVNPGQNVIGIRGISGQRGNSALVGVYQDEASVSGGVKAGFGVSLDVTPIDLQRIEVLKGPQGTLFGEGAVGGVVRYVTKDPNLDQVEGNGSISYLTTRNGQRGGEVLGVLNVPVINDVLGLRIAGNYKDEGGWIDNVGTGEKDFNNNKLKDVRLKALFAPTPELAVRALVDVHRLDAGGANIVNVPPFDRSQFQQAFDLDFPTNFSDHFELYNLTATYDLGFATLLSSTSHFDQDIRQGLTQLVVPPLLPAQMDILFHIAPTTASTTSQELRLTSNGAGSVKWLIGGNFKKSEASRNWGEGADVMIPSIGFPIPGINAGLRSDNDSEAYAGFADGSYIFRDRLEVGGGVRYFHDEQELEEFLHGTRMRSAGGDFEKTTYRAFVKYHFSDDVNVYINTATGFRSGGFNSASAQTAGFPTYGPETSVFYEAGVKGSVMHRKLGFELAYFQGEFKDQLQDVTVPNSVIQYTLNAGVAEIKGVEWLFTLLPMEKLIISVGGDVTDTEFTKAVPTAPVHVGDPIDFVPKYSVILTADYAFGWGKGIPGYINVSSSWKGPMQHTEYSSPGLPMDKTSQLHFLQASISARWNEFDFNFFARNILDERDRINPLVTGVWGQARPRSFGIGVSKSF